jgi:mannitol operon repressor
LRAALPPTPLFDDSDAELLAMQKLRYQQMVRSTMMLSLTELISRISLKKPFRNQRSDPAPSGRRSAGKADDNIPDAAETTLPYPAGFLAVHAADAEIFSNTP